jgi:chromosomal replication initiation ATPase DnaA
MEDYKHKLKLMVAEVFEVDQDFYLRGRERKRAEMYAKKAFVSLLKKYMLHTFMDVARYIGCSEHSGTLYHINDADFMLKYDDNFSFKYRTVEKELLKMMEP